MSVDDTKKTVDELEDRDLDAAVAVELVGWEKVEGRGWFGPDDVKRSFSEVPHYSTDISAAWRVVEGLDEPNAQGLQLHLNRNAFNWEATFIDLDLQYEERSKAWACRADTAPEAICRAALKAVRADD